MKRTYTKPDIMFESFTLSTNIAGGCEIKIYNPSNTSCGYQPEGLSYKIFLSGITECEAHGNQVINDDEGNGFCYHVPIASNNLFNS